KHKTKNPLNLTRIRRLKHRSKPSPEPRRNNLHITVVIIPALLVQPSRGVLDEVLLRLVHLQLGYVQVPPASECFQIGLLERRLESNPGSPLGTLLRVLPVPLIEQRVGIVSPFFSFKFFYR